MIEDAQININSKEIKQSIIHSVQNNSIKGSSTQKVNSNTITINKTNQFSKNYIDQINICNIAIENDKAISNEVQLKENQFPANN